MENDFKSTFQHQKSKFRDSPRFHGWNDPGSRQLETPLYDDEYPLTHAYHNLHEAVIHRKRVFRSNNTEYDHDLVYEYEKSIPFHKSNLEASKFKTVIFLSGQK